jgi:fructose transport system substrate-binding protein
MENCLTKNPNINLVYTINEPSAAGANAALKAAGKESQATVVSIDGSCDGVKIVKEGVIGATSQQYPIKMATMGVDAIASLVRDKVTPTTSAGLDFFNTGTVLVTDKPVAGVDSIDTTAAAGICWG